APRATTGSPLRSSTATAPAGRMTVAVKSWPDRSTVVRIVVCVMGAACASGASVHAQNIRAQIDAAVDQYVAAGLGQEFTRCKLQDALWGRYDVTVNITSGADFLPWRFSVRNGEFTREI